MRPWRGWRIYSFSSTGTWWFGVGSSSGSSSGTEHAPEYRGRLRRVWLWDDWPDRPSRDLGIDLVAEDSGGGVWAIQAKAYGPDYSVTKRDVDSFLAASSSKRFSYRLLVATTDRSHPRRRTRPDASFRCLQSSLTRSRATSPDTPPNPRASSSPTTWASPSDGRASQTFGGRS